MSHSAIPLGELDGQMFRAYEVENGLRCGCVCPACRGALVAANQGEKRFPYFRHAELEACSSGRAEGIRRAVVQVLARHKQLLLPQFNGLAELKAPGDRLLTKPVEFAPVHVVLDEERFVDLGDELRAHALVTCRGRQLVVRIKVSARRQHERTRRIKEMPLSSIEIDLHQLTDEQINDQEYFTQAVLGDAGNRSWIRSLRGELMVERALAELQAELQQLERQWALAEAQRIEQEAALERQRTIEQVRRAQALVEHRLLQQELRRQQASIPQADCGNWNTPQQRRELIAATMLMAAREWSGHGVECGVCHLINAPGSTFCLYCDAEDRRMRAVHYPADLAETLDARLRCSNYPEQSVKAAPSLVVIPEVAT